MSYDIWLTIDTGAPDHAQVTEGRNMTSNVAPMWRLAGADLADFHGRLAGECLPLLRQAVAAMRADPATYIALNPDNGWGDHDGCVRFLEELAADFEAHPKATVAVYR